MNGLIRPSVMFTVVFITGIVVTHSLGMNREQVGMVAFLLAYITLIPVTVRELLKDHEGNSSDEKHGH